MAFADTITIDALDRAPFPATRSAPIAAAPCDGWAKV